MKTWEPKTKKYRITAENLEVKIFMNFLNDKSIKKFKDCYFSTYLVHTQEKISVFFGFGFGFRIILGFERFQRRRYLSVKADDLSKNHLWNAYSGGELKKYPKTLRNFVEHVPNFCLQKKYE